jgi:hypothetical protein
MDRAVDDDIYRRRVRGIVNFVRLGVLVRIKNPSASRNPPE